MHIKHIHAMIEKLSECAKVEMDKGIENIDTKEMGEVADMIKDLAEAEYYAKISKTMDESEYGEDYDYMGAYDEQDRKGYRGQPRDSRGRYMSRRGRRRGYEMPMMMHDEDWEDMERMRDIDRPIGRMYYQGGGGSASGTQSGSQGGQSASGMTSGQGGKRSYYDEKDYREGRSGQSRRGYMETKEMNKGNSPEEKKAKMAELEKYMTELGTDVTEMISDASQEEKNLLKQKMQTLIQKIQ